MNYTLTPPQRSRALVVMQFLNGFLYGLIGFFGFLIPLGIILFGSHLYHDFATSLIPMTALLMGMAALSVELMRWALGAALNCRKTGHRIMDDGGPVHRAVFGLFLLGLRRISQFSKGYRIYKLGSHF